MVETKMTSLLLPDKTRFQIDEIIKTEQGNMTSTIIKAVEYYYEQVLMHSMITRLYSFKGKMADSHLEAIDLKFSPVEMLVTGRKDQLNSLIHTWSNIAREKGDEELFEEGMSILNLLN